MTAVLDRPDLEIVEIPEDSGKPRTAHCYCRVCNPDVQRGHVDIATALCGFVGRDLDTHVDWPTGKQVCVVCEDLEYKPCPGCGF